MDADDVDRLEHRLREALALALRRASAMDPAWGRIRAGLAHRYESDALAQDGTSSSRPGDERDVEF